MSTNTLLLATRKGLFVVENTLTQASFAGPHFAGEPLSFVLVDPRQGDWYAALRLGHFGIKLKKSTDRGAHWSDIAAPSFPAKPVDGPLASDTTPWSVDTIWCLTAGGKDQPEVLWAGCIPAGLFRSADGGRSWHLIESLWQDERRLKWFGGGYDQAGIHSILVDPVDSDHITVAVSCGGVWQSFDSGKHWTLIGQGQTANYVPEEMAAELNSQDPHSISFCLAAPKVMWMQHHCGMFRSENAGVDWQALTAPSGFGVGFGFAVAADPHNPARAWYVPAVSDTHRYAVDGALCVLRTNDAGQTFEVLRAGLPQHQAWQLVYRHALAVSRDGQSLALASTTGSAWVSSDGGDQWFAVPAHFPPVSALCWV